MKLSAIRQEASYVMKTEGLDEAKTRFDGLARAQGDAAQSAELLTRQHTAQEKALTRTASKLEAMTRANDAVSASGAKLARMEALIAVERAKGATITDANLRALEALRIKHEAAIEATRKSTAHMNDNARAAGLARHEWINLSRQLQDVGVSLAGGASPFTVLAQQGGQFVDIFTSSRAGASAAIKDFGGSVLRFALHPVTLLAAGIGAATYAALQFGEQQNALERALNGTGRAAGVTADRLRELGEAGAGRSGFSAGEGLELAGRFASTGVAGRNIETLVADSQKFARAFGLDMEKAGEEIAQIVGESGLGAFEKRFGAVSFATKETVRALEASGRYVEAQAEKTRLLSEETRKAKDAASELSKAWQAVKVWATTPVFGIEKAIGHALNGPSLQEQLAVARGDLFYLRARRGLNESSYPGETDAALRVRDLERQIEEQREAARRAARDLETNRLSQDAVAMARRLSPESFEKSDLEGQQSLLRRALGDPETVRKMDDAATGARAALAHLTTQIETWQSTLEKQREDAVLAVREIGARTYAERDAVATERARIKVLRETGDVTRAAVAAESERAKLLAESARKAEEYARQGRDQLALAGLKPYERGRQQIINEARDLREQFLPTNAASPMAAEFNTAGNAARSLADALTESAGRIGQNSAAKPPVFASGDLSDVSNYIRSAAAARDIDPNIAMRVAVSEGLRNYIGDAGSSFGPFQLHYGGIAPGGNRVAGLGDEFTRRTGLDARDPNTWRQQVDFALDWARAHGWGAFHGAARVGIGRREGIGAVGVNDNSRDSITSKFDEGLQARLKAYDIEQIQGPLRAANEEIERQRNLLRAQATAFGQSTEATARAAKEQELLNQFQQQGVPITTELRAAIGATADNFGRYAREAEQAADRQQRIVAAMDELRAISREALGGLISDLAHGRSAAEALGNALSRIGDRLISSGVDTLVDSLFGRSGKAGGGLLGDLFSGLFSAFEEGGVVGAPGGRMVCAPLSDFVGAPHYAAGGAVPVIAHEGELILNAAQQGNLAAMLRLSASHGRNDNRRSGPANVINFHFPQGTDVAAFKRSESQIAAVAARALARGQRNL